MPVGRAAHHANVGQKEGVTVPDKAIETVLEQHSPRLMLLPGVVGVGQGAAPAPSIKVFVVEKTPGLVARIGATINGYAVEIAETGAFRAASYAEVI